MTSTLEIVVLRLLHIVFGSIWVGSAVFMAVIVEPRVRALGPAIQRPVMSAVGKVMGRSVGTSALITIAAGIYMALRLRFFDRFPDDGWSWAILIGFVVSILGFAAGL